MSWPLGFGRACRARPLQARTPHTTPSATTLVLDRRRSQTPIAPSSSAIADQPDAAPACLRMARGCAGPSGLTMPMPSRTRSCRQETAEEAVHATSSSRCRRSRPRIIPLIAGPGGALSASKFVASMPAAKRSTLCRQKQAQLDLVKCIARSARWGAAENPGTAAMISLLRRAGTTTRGRIR